MSPLRLVSMLAAMAAAPPLLAQPPEPEAAVPSVERRVFWVRAAKIAFGLAVFWFAFRDVTPALLRDALRGVDWRWLVVAALSTVLTVGALTQITRNVRLDTEVLVTRPGDTSPQFLTRLRLVY